MAWHVFDPVGPCRSRSQTGPRTHRDDTCGCESFKPTHYFTVLPVPQRGFHITQKTDTCNCSLWWNMVMFPVPQRRFHITQKTDTCNCSLWWNIVIFPVPQRGFHITQKTDTSNCSLWWNMVMFPAASYIVRFMVILLVHRIVARRVGWLFARLVN